MSESNDIRHRIVASNGIRLHIAEAGSGPVVLLIHGFPESWYSWRYQLPALAAAGYHAVALDVRGYGRSSKPTTVPDYRMVKKVGDVVGLVTEFWRGSGHHRRSRLGRADRVDERAVAPGPVSRCRRSVGTVCARRAPRRVRGRRSACARWRGEANEFYAEYFQQPGRAEAEIEADVRQWLLGFYWCASGDVRDGPNISIVPRGTKMRDKFVYPQTMPKWLSEADLDVYTREFEYSGFFGPLSRYRNADRDWEDLAGFAEQADHDSGAVRRRFERRPDDLGQARDRKISRRRCRSCSGAKSSTAPGHWIQQEAAPRTNELLIEFLRAIH